MNSDGSLTKAELDEMVRRDLAGLCWDCGLKAKCPESFNLCVDCYEPGFIYFLESADGYVKIGKSKNLPARIRTLKIQLPFTATIAAVCWSQAMTRDERGFHLQFAHKRMNGEWFLLEESDWGQIRKSCMLSSLAAPEHAKVAVAKLRRAA